MTYQFSFYIMAVMCCLLVVDRIFNEIQTRKMQSFLMYHKDSKAFEATVQNSAPAEGEYHVPESVQLKDDYDRVLREGVIGDVDLEKFKLHKIVT